MKYKLSRSGLVKLGIILALIVVAPYVAPFAIDFVILADLAGLEALILILFALSRSSFLALQLRAMQLQRDIAEITWMMARLPVFQARIYLGHATFSSALLIMCCSIAFACTIWIPVLIFSAQSII